MEFGEFWKYTCSFCDRRQRADDTQNSLIITGRLMGFPGVSDGKEPACNVGDLASTSGLARSPGEGNGYSVHYSCLENSMERGAWQATVHGVTKSRTRLSDFHFFTFRWLTGIKFSWAPHLSAPFPNSHLGLHSLSQEGRRVFHTHKFLADQAAPADGLSSASHFTSDLWGLDTG